MIGPSIARAGAGARHRDAGPGRNAVRHARDIVFDDRVEQSDERQSSPRRGSTIEDVAGDAAPRDGAEIREFTGRAGPGLILQIVAEASLMRSS